MQLLHLSYREGVGEVAAAAIARSAACSSRESLGQSCARAPKSPQSGENVTTGVTTMGALCPFSLVSMGVVLVPHDFPHMDRGRCEIEAPRSERTMQVVFPTAALARGLRFDQWRGSVLLLLSHWRVWIGAPGEERAFHGDGTSENLGLGLQTRRGAGGGRISSESTALRP